jgi:hypothetical protein
MSIGGSYASNLRREICARNADFARQHRLEHVSSNGREPVIVYPPSVDSRAHGNFFPASYKAIQQNASWRKRLNKVHTQAGTSLPKAERRWRELDSCTSSDALLMNIFCCPRVLGNRSLAAMLGVEPGSRPQFGYRPRVPLANGHIDRTEVDLKLGALLVEAKLTEADFQMQSAALVENYRDLEEVFYVSELPRLAATPPIDPFPDYECEPVTSGNCDFDDKPAVVSSAEASQSGARQFDVRQTSIRGTARKTEVHIPAVQMKAVRYVSYQLIRNVLAAHNAGESFCVITDQRRPDLIERWHMIMRCIRLADLRTRCKVLTWQELAAELPSSLQKFLGHKYGIEPVARIFNVAD